jgi:hypothetical protein
LPVYEVYEDEALVEVGASVVAAAAELELGPGLELLTWVLKVTTALDVELEETNTGICEGVAVAVGVAVTSTEAGAVLATGTAVAVALSTGPRQLHALERCLTLESQAERNASGTPVGSVTVEAVNVAQKLAAATEETE